MTQTPDDLIALQFVELDGCILRQRKIFEMLDHGKGARLDRGPGAREAALCLTRLQEARHWLEECKR